MDVQGLSNSMFLTPAFNENKEDGRCHICLRKTKLTREHVPPKSAFNNCTRLWDRLIAPKGAPESANSVRLHGGVWVRTLCAKCNNETCSKYANHYVRFARYLVETPELFDGVSGKRMIRIPSDTFFLAKQIIAMILAIEPVTFAEHNPELRRFVQDESAKLRPNFRLLAFLVPDLFNAGTIARFHARVDTFAPGFKFCGGEISSFPFGFVYASEIGLGYELDTFTDITHWLTESENRADVVEKFAWRLTGVESIYCGVGRRRVNPQIDYL